MLILTRKPGESLYLTLCTLFPIGSGCQINLPFNMLLLPSWPQPHLPRRAIKDSPRRAGRRLLLFARSSLELLIPLHPAGVDMPKPMQIPGGL